MASATAAGIGGLTPHRRSITIGSIGDANRSDADFQQHDSRQPSMPSLPRQVSGSFRPSTLLGIAGGSGSPKKSITSAAQRKVGVPRKAGSDDTVGLLDESPATDTSPMFGHIKSLHSPARRKVEDSRRTSTMSHQIAPTWNQASLSMASGWSSHQAALLGDLVRIVLQLLGMHEVKLAVAFLQEMASLPMASMALGVPLLDVSHLIHRCAHLQRCEQPSSANEWLLMLSRGGATSNSLRPSPMETAENSPCASCSSSRRPSKPKSQDGRSEKPIIMRKSNTIDAQMTQAGSLNGRVTVEKMPDKVTSGAYGSDAVSVQSMNLEEAAGAGCMPNTNARSQSKEQPLVKQSSPTMATLDPEDLEDTQVRRASDCSDRSIATAPPGLMPGFVSDTSDEAMKPSEAGDSIAEDASIASARILEVPSNPMFLPLSPLSPIDSAQPADYALPPASDKDESDDNSIMELTPSLQGQDGFAPITMTVPQDQNRCLPKTRSQTAGRLVGAGSPVPKNQSIRTSNVSGISKISKGTRFSRFSAAASLMQNAVPRRMSEKVKMMVWSTGKSLRSSISERLQIVNAGMELLEQNGLDENWLAIPSHRFILNPSSQGRMTWDCLSLLVILFESMVVPFSLCFDLDTPEALLTFMTVFFTLDICLNFLTGFYRTGVLVMKQSAIIHNYLQTWFLLDILSTFPWGVIFSGSSSTTMLKVWKFGKMLRLVRLLRVAKLNMIVKRIEEIFSSSAMVILLSFSKILALFLMIVHWCACFWGWLGHPDRGSQYQVQGTHFREDCEPGGPCEPSIEGSPWRRRYGVDQETIWHQYIMALRFSAGVFTGSDMGIQPGFWAERVYAICIMMTSFVVCSTIISQIVVVFHKIQKEDAEQAELIQAFKEFMAKRQVPFALQQKVKRYLEYQHMSRKEISAKRWELMDRLSPWLHKELEMHLNKGVLVQHDFFKKMPHEILAHTCTMCKPALAAPGDIILQRGQTAKIMCFLVRGKLHIQLAGQDLCFDDEYEDEQATVAGSERPEDSTGPSSYAAGEPSAKTRDSNTLEPHWSTMPMPQPVDDTDPQGFTLQAPGYIGAASLFMDAVRSYTVIATSHCELLTLTRNDVEWIASEFPSARAYIEKFVEQAENSENGIQDISVRSGSEEQAILKRLT